mmetsp:Transcript_28244/g.50805  ORF Transcript_28244/g.50805 Transcript_28244/m.50805 type:complete len:1271 (-) Transcript_28244:1128-4940(-)
MAVVVERPTGLPDFYDAYNSPRQSLHSSVVKSMEVTSMEEEVEGSFSSASAGSVPSWEVKWKQDAATLVQKRWRGVLGRRKYVLALQQRDEEEEEEDARQMDNMVVLQEEEISWWDNRDGNDDGFEQDDIELVEVAWRVHRERQSLRELRHLYVLSELCAREVKGRRSIRNQAVLQSVPMGFSLLESLEAAVRADLLSEEGRIQCKMLATQLFMHALVKRSEIILEQREDRRVLRLLYDGVEGIENMWEQTRSCVVSRYFDELACLKMLECQQREAFSRVQIEACWTVGYDIISCETEETKSRAICKMREFCARAARERDIGDVTFEWECAKRRTLHAEAESRAREQMIRSEEKALQVVLTEYMIVIQIEEEVLRSQYLLSVDAALPHLPETCFRALEKQERSELVVSRELDFLVISEGYCRHDIVLEEIQGCQTNARREVADRQIAGAHHIHQEHALLFSAITLEWDEALCRLTLVTEVERAYATVALQALPRMEHFLRGQLHVTEAEAFDCLFRQFSASASAIAVYNLEQRAREKIGDRELWDLNLLGTDEVFGRAMIECEATQAEERREFELLSRTQMCEKLSIQEAKERNLIDHVEQLERTDMQFRIARSFNEWLEGYVERRSLELMAQEEIIRGNTRSAERAAWGAIDTQSRGLCGGKVSLECAFPISADEWGGTLTSPCATLVSTFRGTMLGTLRSGVDEYDPLLCTLDSQVRCHSAAGSHDEDDEFNWDSTVTFNQTSSSSTSLVARRQLPKPVSLLSSEIVSSAEGLTSEALSAAELESGLPAKAADCGKTTQPQPKKRKSKKKKHNGENESNHKGGRKNKFNGTAGSFNSTANSFNNTTGSFNTTKGSQGSLSSSPPNKFDRRGSKSSPKHWKWHGSKATSPSHPDQYEVKQAGHHFTKNHRGARRASHFGHSPSHQPRRASHFGHSPSHQPRRASQFGHSPSQSKAHTPQSGKRPKSSVNAAGSSPQSSTAKDEELPSGRINGAGFRSKFIGMKKGNEEVKSLLSQFDPTTGPKGAEAVELSLAPDTQANTSLGSEYSFSSMGSQQPSSLESTSATSEYQHVESWLAGADCSLATSVMSTSSYEACARPVRNPPRSADSQDRPREQQRLADQIAPMDADTESCIASPRWSKLPPSSPRGTNPRPQPHQPVDKQKPAKLACHSAETLESNLHAHAEEICKTKKKELEFFQPKEEQQPACPVEKPAALPPIRRRDRWPHGRPKQRLEPLKTDGMKANVPMETWSPKSPGRMECSRSPVRSVS